MDDSWILRLRSDESNLHPQSLVDREWLVTNGLGGYASGTILGIATRRYHSLLTVSLPAPLGRQVILTQIEESVHAQDGSIYVLGGVEQAGETTNFLGSVHFAEFRLESGLPVWTYQIKGTIFEKRIFMPYKQNTVHVKHQVISGEEPLRWNLRLAVPLLAGLPEVYINLSAPETAMKFTRRLHCRWRGSVSMATISASQRTINR